MASSTFDMLLPGPVKRSLIAKFGLVLLVLGLVVGGVGLAATNQVTAETRQNVESEYRSLAASEATLVQEWVQRNRLTVQLVSTNDAWSADGGMGMALQNKLSTLPNDVANLYVVDVGGAQVTPVASTASGSSVTFPSEARGWLNSREFDQVSEVSVSGVYESRNGEPVVAVASPVGAGGGRVFVMEVTTSLLAESLKSSERTEGTFVQVVNASNTVLVSRSGEENRLSDIGTTYGGGDDHRLEPVTAARNLGSDREAGVLDRTASSGDHGPEVVGYAPVEGTGWVVVVHTPRGELFGTVQTISNFGIFATVFLVLVVGVVGAALGYNVTSPINRLAGKAEEIEEGNLGVDLETARVDEIGQLYASVGSMRDELREKLMEAQEAREEAETARAEAQEAKANAEELAAHLETKADSYGDVMRQCAAGDLTQRLDAQSRSDAMEQIGTEFNEMIVELERAIEQLKDFSEEVGDGGRIVRDGAANVNEASEQVAESIQHISDDAHEQVEQLQAFSNELDAAVERLAAQDLDADARDDVEALKRLCGDVDELVELSEETMAEAQNVAAAAEEQTSSLAEVSQSAEDLIDYAEPLRNELDRFQTDADREFQFGVGRSSTHD